MEEPKLIPLANGKGFAIVDAEDYEELSRYRWNLHSRGYACRSVRAGSKRQIILMHRVVARTPDGMQTDHANSNKLDNRRANLRSCSCAENLRNRRQMRTNTSGFRGVTRDGGRFTACIYEGRKRFHLGSFLTPTDAARAYDEAARERFGEFGRYNFPLPGERSARLDTTPKPHFAR